MADSIKPVQSTSGGLIHSASRDSVTIYAPDGTPHTCAPVDAREILASGNGYTAEPPEAKGTDEQHAEQQSINDNAASGEADHAASAAVSDESKPVSGANRRGGRKTATE